MSGMTDSAGSGELETIVSRLDELLMDMAEIRECLFGARKDYYTVNEVAEYAGRAEYTVRSWVKAGLIRAERIAGTGPKGRLLIPRSELAKLIASGRGEKITNAPLVNDGEPSNEPNANSRHTGFNRPLTVVPASNKPLD
jgi:excisionase family DNA binding protein